MLSWVIRGAEVIDGTGGRRFSADVGIAGGRIVRLGRVGDGEVPPAERVVEGEGLVVTPGFIDAHSHSDLTLPVHNHAESSLCQGITTEVAGSCGWSLAPCKAETQRAVLRNLLRSLTGIGPKDLRLAWHSFGEYAAYLSNRGIGTNLYPVLGQSLLRAHVVGTGKRKATPAEIAAMKAMLKEAMMEGCRGLSTGRSYRPGGSADTDEIVALAEELRPFDGIYTSHIKNESAESLDAVREVIEVGRRAGVKVQVSHHKSVGPASKGLVNESLSLLERARAEGVDINCDVYPYAFAQVFLLRDGLVPHWRNLSAEKVKARLADPEHRAGLRARAEKNKAGDLTQKGADYLLVAAPGAERLEGLDLAEVAGESGTDVLDACCDILLKSDLEARIAAVMDEGDVQTVLRHPLTMVGTDAFAIDGEMPGSVPLHPRHYGTFPRVVGHYARDTGLFDLETAVFKATGLPAAKLGLSDRGTLREGNWADLVLFDAAAIADRATGKHPTLRPEGIRAVFVNGEIAYAAGAPKGVLAGRVLLARR